MMQDTYLLYRYHQNLCHHIEHSPQNGLWVSGLLWLILFERRPFTFEMRDWVLQKDEKFGRKICNY